MRAKSLARRGDVRDAEALYLSVLEKFPANKRARDGLDALGLPRPESTAELPQDEISRIAGLYNRGALEQVLKAGEGLPVRYPRSLAIRNLLGAAYVGLGQFEQAADWFRQMLEIDPHNADGHKNLGYALNALGRHEDAVDCYRKALATYASSAEVHYNLAAALHELTDHDGAIEHYERAMALDPGDAEIPNNLGVLFEETDRLEQAMACYMKALTLTPDSAVPHYNLARVLQALHREDEAIGHYQEAIRINPDNAEALDNLGIIYMDLGRSDDSIACLTKSLLINPDAAEVHNNLGNTLQTVGRADEAADCYRKALALDPGLGEAHSNLSMVTRYESDDPHIAQMLALLDRPTLPDKDRMHLSFALGKAFDDSGDPAQAFSHFAAGNRLFRATLAYDSADDRRLFNDLKSAFSETLPTLGADYLSATATGQKPVFIVGMPRSGTTLVEQILAAHSQVHGAGELSTLGTGVIRTRWSSLGLTAEALRQVRESYLAGMAKIGASQPWLSDKMPLNFRWLGFVIGALPEARIIHVKRDARAVCWSIFRHYWSTGGNPYAYDLREIAAYYRLYEELMDFWHRTFPGRIYDLSYEQLTEQQEAETRNLLEVVGLDWEEACLDFHEVDRPVRTSSSMQVRRKLYQGSSEAWRQYAEFLEPMFDALGSR